MSYYWLSEAGRSIPDALMHTRRLRNELSFSGAIGMDRGSEIVLLLQKSESAVFH